MILKVFHLVAAGLLVALALAFSAQAETYKGNELPQYDVLESHGPIELRRYAPRIVAEVTVAGSRSNSVNQGFSILSSYIFGNNVANGSETVSSVTASTSEKIEMTVPVTQTQTPNGWVIRFMMPSSHTLETLPDPRNQAIRLRELPVEEQLVLSFNGFPGSLKLTRNETILRNFATEAGYDIMGSPRYYFYDGPMTLPGQRRNEIAFQVTP